MRRRLVRHVFWCGVVAGAVQLIFMPTAARATSVIRMSFEELVIRADFVGVVECTTAGGIVARYKVVEAWKGDEAAGAAVTLMVPPDVFEPQFPVVLVGQRFIVAASKNRAQANAVRNAVAGPVPLWWRELNPDYTLPLFQGRVQVQGNGPANAFGKMFDEVAAVGAAVREVCAKSEEAQAVLVVRSHAMMLRPAKGGDDAVWSRIDKAERLDELKEALAATGNERIDEWMNDIVTELKLRRASAAAQAVERRPLPEPTPAQVEEYRSIVLDRKNLKNSWALAYLVEKDPAFVAARLIAWENPKDRLQDVGAGYEMGSYFCFKCPPASRAALIPMLTGAKDDYVRVAAAVYWALDDEAAGTAALKSFLTIPGDPGAWAALALARRGDAEGLRRVLEVFGAGGKANMAGVIHRNLQRQVVVLLSNSAAASGLPPFEPGLSREDEYTGVEEWVRRQGEGLKIVDAWGEVLRKQRVD